jgi:putative ABC transport system permease protein
MTALDRKLFRDLWQIRGQSLAIGLVIACGVATFVMSLSTLASLHRTREAYYDRYRFAQVFAHLKRAPNSLAGRIAEIPGVARVQTRIVEHVTLDVPGLAEPAVGRLISIPDRAAPGLNERYLRGGRYVEPGRDGEVLVSEGFAQAHGLKPGYSVRAILNGRRQRLRIVGVALSPEFVYLIREGDILPDDRRYGVLWVGETELAAAFDMDGAFNDVCMTLEPGASEPEVIRRLDRLLERYGGLGAYGRADQPSHRFISNELKELRGMALVVPTVFLAVASFLLHVVVARLVGTQREQIAALRAFGYTRAEVGWHYLKLVLLIVAFGVALGTVVGARLGRSVTELYTRFFRFPLFEFRLDGGVVAFAALLSGVAAAGGTLASVVRASRQPPAEAMRPEPPARYRPTVIERLGMQGLFTPPVRMILRHLERQPVWTLLTVLGLALAVAVLVLGNFMVDALDYAMESQFAVAQRQDMTLAFLEPTGVRALSDVAHLPGVRRCEPYRSLAVRLRSGHRSRRLGLLALPPDGRLYRVVDISRREVPLPTGGGVLSGKLAEVLAVRAGDLVTVEVLEGRHPVRAVPVTGLVADFAGVAAYMDIRAANRLMGEGDTISGAFLAVDPGRMDELYAELKNSPRVAGVTIKGATLASFRRTIAENLLRMRLFNILFAGVIAAGVVYNAARVALSERSRELATLRVIGFTRAEISIILLGELAILTLAAIPVGLPLGYGLAALVIGLAYDTELFRIPLVIGRSTYGYAATVTAAAALASGLIVRRLLDRLDLVAVLKSKEKQAREASGAETSTHRARALRARGPRLGLFSLPRRGRSRAGGARPLAGHRRPRGEDPRPGALRRLLAGRREAHPRRASSGGRRCGGEDVAGSHRAERTGAAGRPGDRTSPGAGQGRGGGEGAGDPRGPECPRLPRARGDQPRPGPETLRAGEHDASGARRRRAPAPRRLRGREVGPVRRPDRRVRAGTGPGGPGAHATG